MWNHTKRWPHATESTKKTAVTYFESAAKKKDAKRAKKRKLEEMQNEGSDQQQLTLPQLEPNPPSMLPTMRNWTRRPRMKMLSCFGNRCGFWVKTARINTFVVDPTRCGQYDETVWECCSRELILSVEVDPKADQGRLVITSSSWSITSDFGVCAVHNWFNTSTSSFILFWISLQLRFLFIYYFELI